MGEIIKKYLVMGGGEEGDEPVEMTGKKGTFKWDKGSHVTNLQVGEDEAACQRTFKI